MPRPRLAHLAILALLCALVGACTKSERTDTLRASLIAVNAARDGFTSWDRQHQQGIVEAATSRDAVQAALEHYREQRTPVVSGFEMAYRALAVAATQTDDPSLQRALASSSQLIDAVKQLIGSL
jgi:hypothetical protein